MRKSQKTSFLMIAMLVIVAMLAAACAADDSNTADPNGGAEENQQPEETNGNQGEEEEQGEEQESEAGGEVNIYTARHYDVDAELYAKFTEQTGIEVNVVEGNAAELIERLKHEGANSPADLFITVDGGILNTAKVEDLLQPIESDLINEQVPADLRDVDNHWVGLSTRARVIVYAKDRVDPSELSTYEDLANEKWKGRLLVRSSTNLYNLSLLASLISINGEEEAEAWAAGIANNLARDPEGGDRDQAKGVVAGAADVAIMNTYYVGQMSVSDDPEEVAVAEQIGVFFPNQETTGTHVNISGAGLIKHSPNKENAIRLIEFLTAPEAQAMISEANFEYPVNQAAELPEILKSWGEFRHQGIDFADYGEYNPTAVEIVNKVGWK